MPDSMDEIAREIGYVALAAARLERLIGVLQLKLLDSDLGDEILSGQPWRTCVDVSRRLAANRAGRLEGGADTAADPERRLASLREVPEVLRIADDLMQRRNAIVHGAIPIPRADEDGYGVTSWQMKRGGKVTIADWPLAKISDLADQLDYIADEVGRLSIQVNA